MYKKTFLTLFLYSILSSLAGAAIVEDTDLNLRAMPHCPPPKTMALELMETTNEDGTTEVRQAYVSEWIGIKPNEEPPYEALKYPSQERYRKAIENFAIRMMQLFEGKEACDPIAIKYTARFYHYFCPLSETYRHLDSFAKMVVDQFIYNFKDPVFRTAREVSGCWTGQDDGL